MTQASYQLPLLLVAVVVLLYAVAVWLHTLAARQRREALRAFAVEHNLGFDPAHSADIASRFRFLEALDAGVDRYAFNRLTGKHRDRDVLVFDYHYQTESSSAEDHQGTTDWFYTVFLLLLGRSFPELRIGPEGALSRIAQAAGYADIDFESDAFSRAYCVRSADKRFAYDVCNARMIEYLLLRPGTSVEIERDVLAVVCGELVEPAKMIAHLDLLADLRDRMPDYLFEGG